MLKTVPFYRIALVNLNKNIVRALAVSLSGFLAFSQVAYACEDAASAKLVLPENLQGLLQIAINSRGFTVNDVTYQFDYNASSPNQGRWCKTTSGSSKVTCIATQKDSEIIYGKNRQAVAHLFFKKAYNGDDTAFLRLEAGQPLAPKQRGIEFISRRVEDGSEQPYWSVEAQPVQYTAESVMMYEPLTEGYVEVAHSTSDEFTKAKQSRSTESPVHFDLNSSDVLLVSCKGKEKYQSGNSLTAASTLGLFLMVPSKNIKAK